MTNSINTIIPQVIQMTPALARRYLKGNTSNRKPRNHHVERYANDMRAGLWAFAAEPIKIADDGTLLDGQHRLMARPTHAVHRTYEGGLEALGACR